MSQRHVIRTCEWSRKRVDGLSPEDRVAIEAAAERWQMAAGLDEPPVTFSGADGLLLCTSQHVGVLEVDGCTVEILPKLDARLLDDQPPGDDTTGRVMENLLWMLASSGFMELTEADRANLKRDEIRYYDLFAFILAKQLLIQLQAGVPHAYVARHDDLRALRGTINIADQVTRNWNRFDRLSCQWDEFTPDTPLNRVFKSACGVLRRRVANQAAATLLEECLIYLDDAAALDARTALQTAHAIRWDRANDRFRASFDLAVHLLSGEGFQLAHATARTFVFLLDMNRVFEAFAGAVLEKTFACAIQQQAELGHLLIEPRRIRQIPDFQWQYRHQNWIGDAKYKRLDAAYPMDADGEDTEESPSPARLGPADLRQLTVYAEIQRWNTNQPHPPSLMVLFPVVGDQGFRITQRKAWNQSNLYLVPVRVDREVDLAACTPWPAPIDPASGMLHAACNAYTGGAVP
jgi:5-methylcytosine-specific restriction enzyme subunit McrC